MSKQISYGIRCIAACLFSLLLNLSGSAQIKIVNDAAKKMLKFGNGKLDFSLVYDHQARISMISSGDQRVVGDSGGVYSAFKTASASYSSLKMAVSPAVKITPHSVTLSGIRYGSDSLTIVEEWTFDITPKDIRWKITRSCSRAVKLSEPAAAVFMFDNINTWDGAYQDYGGLAWFYLFNKKLDTYGVYSKGSRFWNGHSGNGLNVTVEAPGQHVAMKYTRTADDQLAYSIATSSSEIIPRFDSGTQRRLFLRDRTDVWDDMKTTTAKTTETIVMSYADVKHDYGRGQFKGLDGDQISAVLNTIARIGVIGKNHFGGNSWHTPYGPLCLHEQYIAQMGIGINDPYYLRGYEDCLDFYRDNAIKPDGRVWPRWAYTNEDMMPGQVTPKGFYEAQWGYLLDSNPDLVTNVSELFHQTGDTAWVKTHRVSCEKALDWILARDENKNGLVEMIPGNHTEGRSSDWIDIIWASHENAFVNAKLYYALTLWSEVESILGFSDKSAHYRECATLLRRSFNKSISQGGFWDDQKKCYIHWRDKDGSTHGNNMVTPVNFMAVAYGICEDSSRARQILDTIENQMQKEKLFFWPICLYSYAAGEGKDWQFPFPNYENGDLFLSWGSIAVEAYASYKPELAVKYVHNVLDQYARDGLAFQRYGRAKQDGLGDDILSGNSLAIVGLYRSIYGIHPMYNRFYLQPHITAELAGTKLLYRFRDSTLTVSLDSLNKYSISDGHFSIAANRDFGYFHAGNELRFFNGDTSSSSLRATTNGDLRLSIIRFGEGDWSWTQSATSSRSVTYTIPGLDKTKQYSVFVDDKKLQTVSGNGSGTLRFTCPVSTSASTLRLGVQ